MRCSKQAWLIWHYQLIPDLVTICLILFPSASKPSCSNTAFLSNQCGYKYNRNQNGSLGLNCSKLTTRMKQFQYRYRSLFPAHACLLFPQAFYRSTWLVPPTSCSSIPPPCCSAARGACLLPLLVPNRWSPSSYFCLNRRYVGGLGLRSTTTQLLKVLIWVNGRCRSFLENLWEPKYSLVVSPRAIKYKW